MSDRISLLLANMVTAVDQGFSYDGIVSVPETGLEDAGQRPGLAGWVDSGVGLIQGTIRVMRAAVRVIRKPKPPMDENQKSPVDSGIDPDNNEKPSQTDGGELGSGTGVVRPHTSGRERLPRKISKWVTKNPPSDGQRLPRMKRERVPDNDAHEENTEKHQVQSRPDDQEPREGKDSPPPSDGQRLPRKKSQPLLEDIVYPTGRTSPVPKHEEEAHHRQDVDQEMMWKEIESVSQLDDQGKSPRKTNAKLDQYLYTGQKGAERQPRVVKKVGDVEGSSGPSRETTKK